jgi:hypothetical protein
VAHAAHAMVVGRSIIASGAPGSRPAAWKPRLSRVEKYTEGHSSPFHPIGTDALWRDVVRRWAACASRLRAEPQKEARPRPFLGSRPASLFPHIPRNTTQAVVVVITCGDQNTKSSLFPVSLRRFDRALSPNQTQTSEPLGWLLALFSAPFFRRKGYAEYGSNGRGCKGVSQVFRCLDRLFRAVR